MKYTKIFCFIYLFALLRSSLEAFAADPTTQRRMNLGVEGLTKDGLAFEKTFEIEVR